MINIKKVEIIQAIFIIVLITIIISGAFYIFNLKQHVDNNSRWFEEMSPDDQYSIQSNFVPGFSPLSPTKTQFMIYDKKSSAYIGAFQMVVDNNGKKPDKENYELEWYEDYVVVTVIDYNKKSRSVRVYWEDYK